METLTKLAYVIKLGDIDIGRIAGWIGVLGAVIGLILTTYKKFLKPLLIVLNGIDEHLKAEVPTKEAVMAVTKYNLIFCSEAVIERGYMTTYENEYLTNGLANYTVLGGEDQVGITVMAALKRPVKTSFESGKMQSEHTKLKQKYDTSILESTIERGLEMATVLYAHFDSFDVTKGQIVKKGDRIGRMGNTGISYGAHLHIAYMTEDTDVVPYMHDYNGVYEHNVVDLGGSEEKTMEFIEASDIFEYRGKTYTHRVTNEWLGYNGHYGVDLGAKDAPAIPWVIWNQPVAGKVVQVIDYGDKRTGKTVLIDPLYAADGQLGEEEIQEVNMKVKFNANVNIRTAPTVDGKLRTDLAKPVYLRGEEVSISKYTIADGYLWGGYQPNIAKLPFSWVALTDLVRGVSFVKDISTKR